MEYPIAEMFVSPQGEGIYTGTMMQFIRLAGCTVGRRYPKEMYTPTKCNCSNYHQHNPNCPSHPSHILPIYTERCTLYDGRTFACDTDYRMTEKLSPQAILDRLQLAAQVEHVCITGGEPFMHKLDDLVKTLLRNGYKVHIETSGTVPIDQAFSSECWSSMWITVSPKKGVRPDVVQYCNEIKLLVDKDFNWDTVPDFVKNHSTIYIQPINGENKLNGRNLQLCMDLQKQHPNLRISLQLHKVISDYVGWMVR